MRALGLVRDLEPEATACLPRLEDLRDGLEPSVAEDVAAYLEQGEIVMDVMEMVSDPLDPKKGVPGGSGIQSDGEWVWRQDLAYFVRTYGQDLPNEFVEKARRTEPGPLEPEQRPLAMAAMAEARRG